MNRPFLFMAGEHTVTMPLVFSREEWSHTMSARKLVRDADGKIHRDNVHNESLSGILWYASVENKEVRRHNMLFIMEHQIPCWPNPVVLYDLDDRFEVLKKCRDNDFLQHNVQFVLSEDRHRITLEYPYVLKCGNLHQGQGKFLVTKESDLPEDWDWFASVEPFFEGISCRVLTIGKETFGIKYENPSTWIKNDAGAELELWDSLPKKVFDHAEKVHRHFGLEVSGIDYIVTESGFHLLEYNQFPGVSLEGEISATAKKFLSAKMDEVERKVRQNELDTL